MDGSTEQSVGMGKMIIKEHNKIAYERIKEGFKHSNKVATVCATGTGKSYQALQLIEDNTDKHILYITSLKSVKEQFVALCKQELSYRINAVTYDAISEAKIATQKWDYVIIDEFHRGGAEIWGQKLTQLINSNPNAKFLGLSATPIRYLDDMRNMADELFEGNVVYELTLANAIAEGILPIPEYISCLYSFDGVNQKIAGYENKLKSEKYIKDRDRIKKLIAKAKKLVAESPDVKTVLKNNIHNKQGHYIVFCSDIMQLENMVGAAEDLFSDVNDVTSYSVYTDKKDNKRTLSRFIDDSSSRIKLLFAVNMITEGIHADNISGVIFLRPTASPNVYLQQMGRALSSGKRSRPLIIDMVNNTDCLRLSRDLAEEVNSIIQQSYSVNKTSVEFSIMDYVKQIEDVLKEVEASLYWGWNDWYELAKRYYTQHGNLDMPKRYITEEGYNLGDWVKTQRKEFKAGKASTDHINLLNELKIRWDPLQDLWDNGYEHARQYYLTFGNLLVSTDYVCEDGFNLGIWIINKRIDYRYQRDVLTKERRSLLEEIGMVWNVPDQQWNEIYELAKEYYEKHGHLKVPRSYVTESGIQLGMWVSDRRRNYVNNMLTDEQISKLESIGMVWNVNADAWEKGLKEATTFYERNNDLIVPRDYITEDGYKLGLWISHLREKFKAGKLGQDQIEQLNQIGMVWDRQLIRTRRKKKEDKIEVDPFDISENSYIEGATKQITVNAYERDKKARSKCLEHYLKKDGTIRCQLCGFDFGEFYGDEFTNMIEVHHLTPLSSIRKEYRLNPVEDLIPLCPNCHYVVHAKFDGDVESLREVLAKRAKKN